ncbi:peptidoglycan DD-metalloendopeptidase family protein, partial [Rhodoblastus sp.]|uniref:peptidoglycan DD-metalloendopeptidase family protein n=1 Tax=Rhodoblastus sp. TaxID=1962975 RepID=UPI0035B243DD
MKHRVKTSGGTFRVALIGVATIMLGGCSETGQFGNTFGTPVASSSPRVDRTPTGSVAQAQSSPTDQVSGFFKEAFRPFGDQPASPPPAARPAYAARPAAPAPLDRPVPPAPIASAPLAPPAAAPRYAQPAPFAPAPVAQTVAPKPTYALRSAPNAVGGWTSEGGTPVVVAQGETAETVAQRFGVPTDTLLQLNGYSSRAQVTPGARLTIPVYHAGARAAAAAPMAAPVVAKSAAPRLAAKSLVGEEVAQAKAVPGRAAQTLIAPRADAATGLAEKRAKLAQAQADKLKADKEKVAMAQAEAARKTAEAKAAQVAQAKAAKSPVAAQVAQAQTFTKTAPTQAVNGGAKTVAAATAAVAQAKPAQIQAAAPAAKAEPAKVAKAEANVDAESTASLQPAASAAASGDAANPEFRWPARGRVIQGFGNGGNDGINIAVPEGTQVKAAENGVVAYAGSELKGYGNLVLIRHPNGFVTAYANNGSINVKRGDTVKRGQTIALSG